MRWNPYVKWTLLTAIGSVGVAVLTVHRGIRHANDWVKFQSNPSKYRPRN